MATVAELPKVSKAVGPYADPDVERITIAQFEAAVEAGVYPEDASYELLGGLVVRRIVGTQEEPFEMKPGHAWAVRLLGRYDRLFEAVGCHLMTQQPIRLPDETEPIPDATLVSVPFEAVRDQHPTVATILAIIEVAEGSLHRDLGTKLHRYATAGVPVYIVIDLPNRLAHVHRTPGSGEASYHDVEQIDSAGMLRLPTATDVTIDVPVADLLPAATVGK
jgi:hypothetical protein